MTYQLWWVSEGVMKTTKADVYVDTTNIYCHVPVTIANYHPV